MVSSRFRAALLVVFLFLAGLSLRPSSELLLKLEDLCAPFRAIGALAAPLGWVSVGEARAAERSLLEGEEARRDAARAVLAAAESSAAPEERTLAVGKGLLHAEVVEEVGGDPDRLVVRFAAGAGVRPGMPVVCGDSFVGRVVSVDDREAGLARVDLVTRRDFRVGAQVARPRTGAGGPNPPGKGGANPSDAVPPARFVVGGVLPRGGKSAEVLLEARCRSDWEVLEGEVRVHESERKAEDPYRTLADGFLLGTLEPVVRDEVLGVRPAIDLKAGVTHVGILCPSEHAPAGLDLARDPFGEEHWIEVRFTLAGTASFWRETRVLSRGERSGVSGGAAVVLGSSLLGCVDRADRSTSRVALLGDPGLEITAMASPVASGDPGSAAVIPIGKLVSLGRNRLDGTLRLRWDPSVRATLGGRTEVVLYTASGRRSVPPGLRIGTTALPDAASGKRGPFVLIVHQDATGLSVADVRVWCDVPANPADPIPNLPANANPKEQRP